MSEPATVIVIDDDPAICDGIVDMIEEMGHRGVGFESAQCFLDDYKTGGADCLILDIRMPGMSGMGLLRHLHEWDAGLPVIIITGHGDIPMAVEAVQLGALAFVEKPFREQVLWQNIEKALVVSAKFRTDAQRRATLLKMAESLSAKERAVLKRLITGMSDKEIAHDLKVSRRAIAFHRATILDKLKAANIIELATVMTKLDISL